MTKKILKSFITSALALVLIVCESPLLLSAKEEPVTVNAATVEAVHGINTSFGGLLAAGPVLDFTSKTIYVFENFTITPYDPANNFKSSNSKIAVVDSGGVVYGIKAGKATITVSKDGESKKITVTVKNRKPAITVTKDGYDSLRVDITAMPGATAYVVQRSTKKNKGFKTVTTTGALSYIDNTLKTGTTYYYRVYGTATFSTKSYKTPYSAVKKGKPTLDKPSADPIVTENAAVDSQINVKVNAVPGADGYQYAYRSATKGKFKTKTSTSNNYDIVGLAGAKTYYVKVRAYRMVGKKKVYGPYTGISSVALHRASPDVISISGMRAGDHTFTSPTDYLGITYKYRWVEYTVKNNGKLNLVLYNKVGSENTTSKTMFLGNAKGKKKSSITIKPGQSAKIRFCMKTVKKGFIKYVYYFPSSFSGNSVLTVLGKYDGVKYEYDFIFNYVDVFLHGLTGAVNPDRGNSPLSEELDNTYIEDIEFVEVIE